MTWQDSHPLVYDSLAPEYRRLPAEAINGMLAGSLGVELDAAEGFLDDIGKVAARAARAVSTVAQQAAPVVAQAAPGALSGAVAGAPLGPAGVLGGAVLGGFGSLAAGGGRRVPGAAPAVAATMPLPGTVAVPGVPGVPGVNPPGTAVAQLLTALSSPTVVQALRAMLLGGAGARSVPSAGGAQVPVAAITNLLALLAGRASAEWEAVAPYDGGDYLAGAGATGRDLDSPQVRADTLLTQLAPGWTWAPGPALAAGEWDGDEEWAGDEEGDSYEEWEGDQEWDPYEEWDAEVGPTGGPTPTAFENL